jgi:large subunit ribosomal protein L29
MKAKELIEQTVDELKVKERDLNEQLFQLRFQAATAQLEKPAKIRQVKRDLARIKTVIRQKDLATN